MGGGGEGFESIHSIFNCENNRKSNKITHCVEFFLKSSYEDVSIFRDK